MAASAADRRARPGTRERSTRQFQAVSDELSGSRDFRSAQDIHAAMRAVGNQVGLATFAVLWVMRISAKLNVFLGVRNLSIELLPPHLMYLASYFRRRAMNLLFPLSITASTVVAAWMVNDAFDAPAGSAFAVGRMLVSTLLLLGILEHWLLVMPFQVSVLWRWAMREHREPPPPAAPDPLLMAPLETDEKLLHAR